MQAIADLDGRGTDVGEPVNGARHDAAAFFISGIAERWATHLTPDGPGTIGDGGYQGAGLTTPVKKPPGGDLTDKQKAYNHSVNRLRAAVDRAISHSKTGRSSIGYHRIMINFPDVLRTVTALEIFRATAPGLHDPPSVDTTNIGNCGEGEHHACGTVTRI